MDNIKWLSIEALDSLFFRDGRPFTKGEDTWGDQLFPPFPSMVYGAIRGKWVSDLIHQKELMSTEQNDWYNELPAKTSGLKMPYLFLAVNKKGDKISIDDFRFPYPQDHVVFEDPEKAKKLTLEEVPGGVVSIYNKKWWLIINEKIKSKDTSKRLITRSDLQTYCETGEINTPGELLSKYTTVESKVGIGRELLSGTTKEGSLYRISMIRSESTNWDNKVPESSYLSIIAGIENSGSMKTGMLRLGGEGKISGVSYLNPDIIDQNDEKKQLLKRSSTISKQFKILFLTPAIFISKTYGESPLENWCKRNNLELLTGAIGRIVNIGGFDIRKNQPKTMYRALPAGSVLYVQAADNAAAEVFIKNSFLRCLSDIQSEQGFGLAVIAPVSNPARL